MPDGPTTRRRRTPSSLNGKWTLDVDTWNSGGQHTLSERTSGRREMSGSQVTASEGHPFHSRGRSGDDVGGEFSTTKRYVEGGVVRGREEYTNYGSGLSRTRYVYNGAIMAPIPGTGENAYPPSAHSSNATLDKLGATAIARCAPGHPPVNALTFLTETLKEGIPSMIGSETWKGRAGAAKAAGSDYLNLQFGWRPLVSDISSLANRMINADAVLAQYERDAGKQVRRRYQFPTETTTESLGQAVNQTAWMGASNGGFFQSPYGTMTVERVTTRRQWFSGAFTYYLPSGYESRNGMSRLASDAQHLLGLSLTPDVLWELAPWSWAIDWVSNTGDVVKNVSRFASGGLIMRYGYMMEHSIRKDIYTLDRTGLKSGRRVPPIALVTETKVRRKANPFGFGLTWEGLSSFQASILAALGITKFGK